MRPTGTPSDVGLDRPERAQAGRRPGDPQLVERRARRGQDRERSATAKRHALEHRVGELAAPVAARQADERPAQRRVVALAVAQVREEERRRGPRDRRRAGAQPGVDARRPRVELGEASKPSRSTTQRDGGARRVDARSRCSRRPATTWL